MKQLYILIGIILLMSCQNEDNKNNTSSRYTEINGKLNKIIDKVSKVSIEGSFNGKTFSIIGLEDGEYLNGKFEFLNNESSPLRCYGYLGKDTIELEMLLYKKTQPDVYYLEAYKESNRWTGKIIDRKERITTNLNSLTVSEKVDMPFNYITILLENHDNPSIKVKGIRQDGLKIQYPQMINTDVQVNKDLNNKILSSIFMSFNKEVNSLDELNKFYQNEIKASYTGSMYYQIKELNDTLISIYIGGGTMDVGSGVRFPGHLLLYRRTSESYDISKFYNVESLKNKLTSKFKKEYNSKDLRYQKCDGIFIPTYFIKSKNGVAFFNETGTFFNSAIYLKNNSIPSYTY